MNKMIYQIQGVLFQSPSEQDNMLEVNEVFTHENPLVARKDAFRKFQSYVDVFLDSLDLRYSSDEQAQVDLRDYLKSKKKALFINIPALEIEVDFDKGLYLYFINDSTDNFITKEGVVTYNKKLLIRCIDGGQTVSPSLMEKHCLVEKSMLNVVQVQQKQVENEMKERLTKLSTKK